MYLVNAKNKKGISKINGVNKYTLYFLFSVLFCLSFPSNLAYSEQTIDSVSLEEFTDGTNVLMAKKMPAHRTKAAKPPRSKRAVGKPQAKRPGMRKASNIQKKNKSARSKYKSNRTKSPKYKKSRIGKNQKKIKPQRRVKPNKAVTGSFRKKSGKTTKNQKPIGQKSVPKYLQKKVKSKLQGAKKGNKLWKKSINFQGNKVFQRNDLINPKLVDGRGRTNLERMKKGLAPLGPDGKSINLHHMTQRHNGAIAEMTQTFHQKNSKVIHINPNSVPSGINRAVFNKWRSAYWKSRANDF